MKDYKALYERCKQQAQVWKQEARTANATIGEIYQLVTGKRGEPGNWNGAEPVRKLIAERDALLAASARTLKHLNDRIDAAVAADGLVPLFDGIAELHDAVGAAQASHLQ